MGPAIVKKKKWKGKTGFGIKKQRDSIHCQFVDGGGEGVGAAKRSSIYFPPSTPCPPGAWTAGILVWEVPYSGQLVCIAGLESKSTT